MEKTVRNTDAVIANKALQKHNPKTPRFFRTRPIDRISMCSSTEDGLLSDDPMRYKPKPKPGNRDNTKKKVFKSKHCKSKLLNDGPEIVPNPIDVKNNPNILPLLVGLAKSYMAAMIIGEKKTTAIPRNIRAARSEPQSDRKPRSRNDDD